jgi:hypothetical protein
VKARDLPICGNCYQFCKNHKQDKVMNIRIAPFVAALAGLIIAIIAQPAMAAGKSGSFSGVDGHTVSGSATVSMAGGKTTVTLSKDFSSQSGPDLYIYVGTGSPTKRIAKLKSFKGGQSYTFSGTAAISSVHVYCKQYSVGFGTAKMK